MTAPSQLPRAAVEIAIETPGGTGEPLKLPARIGILADVKGQTEPDPECWLDPGLVKEISADTFDQVIEEIAPGINIDVPDVISGQPNATLNVQLAFTSMDDFTPARLAAIVPQLRALLEKRQRLNEWRNRLSNQPRLARQLRDYLRTQTQSTKR